MKPTTYTPRVKVTEWGGYSHAEIPTAFRAMADYIDATQCYHRILTIDFWDGDGGWEVSLIEEVV